MKPVWRWCESGTPSHDSQHRRTAHNQWIYYIELNVWCELVCARRPINHVQCVRVCIASSAKGARNHFPYKNTNRFASVRLSYSAAVSRMNVGVLDNCVFIVVYLCLKSAFCVRIVCLNSCPKIQSQYFTMDTILYIINLHFCLLWDLLHMYML